MPSSPEPIRRRELLILDTGPIWELVLFHAVDQFGFERLRRELQFIKDQQSYGRCGQFIGSFRRKTTSASVVAELGYQIRRPKLGGQEKLWNRVYEEFQNMGMDEEVIRLVEMSRLLVVRMGPVDVSLLELARRHADELPVVLTVDSALYRECMNAGLCVSLLQELTAIWEPLPK